jgi:Zn ribbon nucleic-acid-binding protein
MPGHTLVKMQARTKDTYKKDIYDFLEREVLVVCPKCHKKASIKTGKFSVAIFSEETLKLVCSNCGYNKKLSEKQNVSHNSSTDMNASTGRSFTIGNGKDPFFDCELWLTKQCADNNLWAYNYEHLDFLHNHVQATLRERNDDIPKNRSLGSRLPKWITSQKNRDSILKCIEDLKKK